MVKIRLSRIGKKKVPFYKIIVSDSREPIHGRFIEQIGTYDPNTDPGTVKIDEEKAKKWLSQGAQPTNTVSKLFKQAGIKKG
ncbi:MAG: 30S ribosomal protein S16 [Lachnospiraceae bacterium]|nr:30S ribosomal protein S16 [Lachnospiraceae bacterium]